MSKKKQKLVRVVVPFVLKAAADQESRTFEGLAATWDEDLGQDIITRGAFKNSLVEWKAGNDAMPLLNSHNHFDIFSAIGQMTSAKETKDGLDTSWEVLDGPDGDRVMERLRPSKTTGRPVIGKMSIGFIPTKFSFEQPEGTEGFFDRIRHIDEAQLKEVSLVLFPMNPNASIDAGSVKMFLKSMEDTDPRELGNLDRMQLRKLASRIGILLKQDKVPIVGRKAEDPPEDEEIDEDDDIEEPKNPPAVVKDPSDEDDSDDTDSDETDTEITDPNDKSGTPPADVKKEDNGVYQMSEALQHRLQRTLLRNKTSELQEGNS